MPTVQTNSIMFTSFVAVQSATSSPVSSISTEDASRSRAKRKQVARACTLCRINRTKCDDNTPCSSCKIKGSSCSKSGSINARTLSTANREIDELRAKVKALESIQFSSSRKSDNAPPSPPCSATPQSLCSPAEEVVQTRKCKSWPGVKLHNPSTGNVQYYGPSSSFVFLDRISSFLSSVLPQPLSALDLLPSSKDDGGAVNDEGATQEMPFQQQECLLNLFWQTYHCLFPVVCEHEFRELFKSLWLPSLQPGRRPSPVVDIMLALCIQYGHAFLKEPESSDTVDLRSAFYYNRCRSELAKEWENPSISTVQAYIFITVYLQNLSNLNAAQLALTVAVRAAFTIGLHLEPPDDIPRHQQEIRRRIWWGLYVLDVKLGVELGRPWAIDTSQVVCALPADDFDLAQASGLNLSLLHADTNWLCFYAQSVKLAIAARSVHEKFYSESLEILASSQADEVYKDPHALEACADLMRRSLEPLLVWVKDLPEGLKNKRKDSGSPLSTDRTSLDVEVGAPCWVQLQRVSLELSYHSFAAAFYRPFIYFTPHSLSTTPLADGLGCMASSHSTMITTIIHQLLNGHDTLAGWYDAYHALWNAALTMQGFAIAYPVCPPAPRARKSVNLAIEAFDLLGKDIPMASDAATIMRDLTSKARLLMDQFRKALNIPAAPSDITAAVNVPSHESGAWLRSPSPWLGEILNLPAAESLHEFGSDILWPDPEQCNVEMWANFLNSLEGSFPETESMGSMDMRI